MKALKFTILPMLVGTIPALFALPASAQVPRDYVRQHAYEADQQGFFPGRQKQGLEQQTDAGNFDNSPRAGGYSAFYPPFPPIGPSQQNGVVQYRGREQAWLGVSLSETSRNGVQITNIAAGSPAAQVGLHPGDHILGIDQQTTAGYRDVIRVVNNSAPGSQVLLHLDRSGRRSDVAVTLAAVPQQVQTGARTEYRAPMKSQ